MEPQQAGPSHGPRSKPMEPLLRRIWAGDSSWIMLASLTNRPSRVYSPVSSMSLRSTWT